MCFCKSNAQDLMDTYINNNVHYDAVITNVYLELKNI